MKNSMEYLKELHAQDKIIEDILNLKEFVEILDKDVKDKNSNVLIENNMLIHDNINGGYLKNLKLQFSGEIGDKINIKLLKMVGKINITNEFIVESNKWFNYIKDNEGKITYLNTYSYNKVEKCNEIIVHDIKKYIETLLEIDWILRNYESSDIEYDSLGKMIHRNNIKNFNKYSEYFEFFRQINDIDNSYKHSIVNDRMTFLGIEKNCIIVIESKKEKNMQKIYEGKQELYYLLDDMIKQFNDFFKFSIDNINKIKIF